MEIMDAEIKAEENMATMTDAMEIMDVGHHITITMTGIIYKLATDETGRGKCFVTRALGILRVVKKD